MLWFLYKLNIFLATLDGVTADLNKIKLFLFPEKGWTVHNQEYEDRKNDDLKFSIWKILVSLKFLNFLKNLVFWPCEKSYFLAILKLIKKDSLRN